MNVSHAVNCKVCKKPFHVEVDPDYADMGDPQNLFPLATCNRCYDYILNRRKAMVLIFKRCDEYAAAKAAKNLTEEKESKFKRDIMNYVTWFCDITENYYNRKEPDLKSDLTDQLIDNPGHTDTIFKAYMHAFRNNVTPELILAEH